MTQSSLCTDLPLPVNEEDVLCLLVVLWAAEAPLDVHLCPLLVKLLAAPGTAPACSTRSSDIASAAPEIRGSQHHLHLAPLHLNCSTSSSTELSPWKPDANWQVEKLWRRFGKSVTVPNNTNHGHRPHTAQQEKNISNITTHNLQQQQVQSVLLSPVPYLLSPAH